MTQILAYDPATDSLSALASTLAIGVEAPAVFWDGSLVWILGGKVNTTTERAAGSEVIQTFEPKSGQVQSIGHLPYGVWDAPSFTEGRKYYLPGGFNTSTTGYTSIIAFDPVDRSSSFLSFAVPVRLAGRVGTWVSSVGAAYLFGGTDHSTNALSDKIVRIVP